MFALPNEKKPNNSIRHSHRFEKKKKRETHFYRGQKTFTKIDITAQLNNYPKNENGNVHRFENVYRTLVYSGNLTEFDRTLPE